MATSTSHPRPARTLVIFLSVLGLMFAGMAALKSWTPKLGLDLRGGTTITLTARNSTGSGTVDQSSLELARQIIQRRVDSLGVGESSVTVSGSKQIVIAVPNVNRDQLVRMVGQTAQLQFRPVLGATPIADESATVTTDTATPNPTATAPVPTAGETPAAPAPSATGDRLPATLPTAAPTTRSATSTATEPVSITDAMAYQPSEQDIKDFQAYKCGDSFPDLIDQPLISCDKSQKMKYFLGPSVLSGKNVKDAMAAMPQGQLQYIVNLNFDGDGTKLFSDITTKMAGQQEPQNQLGIVLDGSVISSPRINEPISGGSATISGSFTQQSAEELSNVLKYGALPLTFDTSSVDNVSATLGGEQLRAGIIAGLIGLLLVIGYAFLYYRGLGIVVVLSLLIAGLMTYAALVLLGQSLDLALNLPGIAGAIVAIGITADSFIIYFERIRDDVRDGRSLRTAIETGWRKARPTIVIADCVSLLSATVLFFLAIGAVQGFAFTLGLTTLIDLAIIFFWTKPLMSVLGRTKFFGEGHPLSGLDASHMGVEKVNTARTVAAIRAKDRVRTKSKSKLAEQTDTDELGEDK